MHVKILIAGPEAEIYVQKLRTLQNDYAMRMPTVADRILERLRSV